MSDLKATMARIIDEGFNQGDIDALDELISDDFVEHEDLPPGVPPGKAALRAMITMMRAAFPDLHVTVEDMLQDGSKVVTRSRFSGTHRGDFMGIPPTGNEFDIPVIDIIEFRDGQAVAHWGVMDNAAMLEQLGVAGPPAQAVPSGACAGRNSDVSSRETGIHESRGAQRSSRVWLSLGLLAGRNVFSARYLGASRSVVRILLSALHRPA